ncbi:MAG: ATP12 family protein [Novosphingobium sp.]
MKRFYKDAAPERLDEAWRVALDGRAIKTVAGRAQLVPTKKLAAALAAEWNAQEDELAPELFVLRDLTDYALDVVAPDRPAAVRALLAFAETDTLCYRAEEGEPLHGRQLIMWEPLLAATERRWDVHFSRVSGVIHQAQATATLDRLEAVIAAKDDFELAALHTLASLTASLAVGLAALERDADPYALWAAANLEEDWQAEIWGKDDDAMVLRENRFATFAAAMRFAEMARRDA